MDSPSRPDTASAAALALGLGWLQPLRHSPALYSIRRADQVRRLPSSVVVLSTGSPVLRAVPTAAPLSPTSPLLTTYRARRSQSTRQLAPDGSHCWGGDGSLLFPRWLCQRSTPSTPLGSSGLHVQVLRPFHGLRPWIQDSAPSWLLSEGRSRRGRLRFMLRTAGLHLPDSEGSTPRFDAQVSPNVGGLLRRCLGTSFGRTSTG